MLAAGIALAVTLLSPPTDDLQLVGCATRSILFHEIYRLSLYEGEGERELIRMRILHGGEMPDGLPGDWPPRLARTVDAETIGEIDQAFGMIEPGSVVDIEYDPAEDVSTMTIDRQLAVTDAHRTTYDAISAMWFGEDPISDHLAETIGEGECKAP